MKCMNCGKELGDKEAYCEKCGLPIPGRANKVKNVHNNEEVEIKDNIDSKFMKLLLLFIFSGLFGFHNISGIPEGWLGFLSILLSSENELVHIFKVLFFSDISICIFILLNIMSMVGIVMLAIKNPQKKDLRNKMAIVLAVAVALYIVEIFNLSPVSLFV